MAVKHAGEIDVYTHESTYFVHYYSNNRIYFSHALIELVIDKWFSTLFILKNMGNGKYRTSFRRILAAFIDALVLGPLSFISYLIYKKSSNQTVLFTTYAVETMIPIFYSIIFHFKYGYTIGKYLVDVKVLDLTESKLITFKQSLYRDSFYLIITIGTIIYSGVIFLKSSNLESSVKISSNFFHFPVPYWTIIEIITMMTNKKRRALHDFLAGSVVVKVTS